jgi:hypothetical protein
MDQPLNETEKDIPLDTEGCPHEGDTNPLSIQTPEQVTPAAQAQQKINRYDDLENWIKEGTQ